jgi:hypothetical protein
MAPPRGPPPYPRCGGGLIYDLDVTVCVSKVAKERRLGLEMGIGVLMYGSGVKYVQVHAKRV